MKQDEIYAEYLSWCVKNGLPPLNPLQYEKVVRGIQDKFPSGDKMPRKKDST